MDRREFLKGAAGLGGAVLLAGCGSSSSSGGGASTQAKRPGVGKEPGNLNILEWPGYEADGTKAQTYGMIAGKDYTKKFGTNIAYTYITNDDQALQKASSGVSFDLLHPCHENIPDYVSRGLVQPFDTSLLPSFSELNPYLVKQGQINGQQYMIPWDWGYASVLYRADKIDAADAKGWELFWNEKYSGKISVWNGSASNLEYTGLLLDYPQMDNMSSDQLSAAKAKLIQQKPLNKFYWSSEYGAGGMQPAFKSGDIWITYSWQDAYVSMKAAGLDVVYMQPSQGRLSWFCGFMLGKDTKNYYHCHDYVESFINQKACAQMTNLFAYGTSNTKVLVSDIKDQALAKSLDLGNPHAIAGPDVHLQSWEKNRSQYELAWSEVQAA
ncbi:MAG TPA: substrate-binding domain-containing protein [Gaiellales bacterium]